MLTSYVVWSNFRAENKLGKEWINPNWKGGGGVGDRVELQSGREVSQKIVDVEEIIYL